MKVHCLSLEYGFGDSPIITLAVGKMIDSFTREQAKSIEIVVGEILEGRQVVLSGKEIAVHNPAAMAPHEVSMYTSVCQNNVELSTLVEKLQAENARLTIKLEKYQKVIDASIDNDRAMFMLSTQSETARKRREELRGR